MKSFNLSSILSATLFFASTSLYSMKDNHELTDQIEKSTKEISKLKKKCQKEINDINKLKGDKETKEKMIEQTKAKYKKEERQLESKIKYYESKSKNIEPEKKSEQKIIPNKEIEKLNKNMTTGSASDFASDFGQEVKSYASDFGQEVKIENKIENKNIIKNEKWIKVNGQKVTIPTDKDIFLQFQSREDIIVNKGLKVFHIKDLWKDLYSKNSPKFTMEIGIESGDLYLPGIPYERIKIISNNPKYQEQLNELINQENKKKKENAEICNSSKNERWVQVDETMIDFPVNAQGVSVQCLTNGLVLVDFIGANSIIIDRKKIQTKGNPGIAIRMDYGSFSVGGISSPEKLNIISTDPSLFEETLGRLRDGMVKISGK